jgi:hypothetical protein
MHAVGTQLLRQRGASFKQGRDVARLGAADQRLGDGPERFIGSAIGGGDQQAGDIGAFDPALELLQEVAQENAARNQFGRRRQIEPTGFAVDDDAYSLPW